MSPRLTGELTNKVVKVKIVVGEMTSFVIGLWSRSRTEVVERVLRGPEWFQTVKKISDVVGHFGGPRGSSGSSTGYILTRINLWRVRRGDSKRLIQVGGFLYPSFRPFLGNSTIYTP